MKNSKFVFNGHYLKEKRIKSNLTLEELALVIDSSKSYIWELENNRKANPSFLKIVAISHYLKADLKKFYKE